MPDLIPLCQSNPSSWLRRTGSLDAAGLLRHYPNARNHYHPTMSLRTTDTAALQNLFLQTQPRRRNGWLS
jgi:hypothetical protein